MKITVKQKQELKKIAAKYGLNLILLFGSRISGRERPDSDLDIAVQFKNQNYKYDLGLIGELSGVFGKNADLIAINRANPLLLNQISKNCLIAFGARKVFFNFRLRAFHRYNDYEPYFRLEERFVKKQVKELKLKV